MFPSWSEWLLRNPTAHSRDIPVPEIDLRDHRDQFMRWNSPIPAVQILDRSLLFWRSYQVKEQEDLLMESQRWEDPREQEETVQVPLAPPCPWRCRPCSRTEWLDRQPRTWCHERPTSASGLCCPGTRLCLVTVWVTLVPWSQLVLFTPLHTHSLRQSLRLRPL